MYVLFGSSWSNLSNQAAKSLSVARWSARVAHGGHVHDTQGGEEGRGRVVV